MSERRWQEFLGLTSEEERDREEEEHQKRGGGALKYPVEQQSLQACEETTHGRGKHDTGRAQYPSLSE